MVFCFVQNFFFGQHKNQNINCFCRAWGEFFFQILTLGYMTKTLNQIIFFFLHQNQNIFFSNIGNQNIFLEKNHNQVKWSFPQYILFCILFILHDYTIIHTQNILIHLSKQTFCNTTLKFHSPRRVSNGNPFYIRFVQRMIHPWLSYWVCHPHIYK